MENKIFNISNRYNSVSTIVSPTFSRYCSNVFHSGRLVWEMSLRDLQKFYVQSTLGLLWVILDPIVTMGLLLFVFTVGIKGGAGPLTEFIPYVFSGLVVYYFFTQAIRQASSSFTVYSFLVKKVSFKLEVLPLVRVISCFWIHIVFLFLLVMILASCGVYPNLYWLQLFYYVGLQIFFVFALGTILAAIEPFFKDLKKIIPIVTRLMFWCTPIFWHADRVPEKFKIFLQINPLYFFVNGYRNSLIYSKPLTSDLPMEFIYIGVSLVMFLIGYKLQTELKPYFAEYL